MIARLVDVLEGTDAGRLAECLGLDPGRFRGGAHGGWFCFGLLSGFITLNILRSLRAQIV